MRQLRELKDEHIIKVITGVRRCGKSTLLEMFADELRQNVPERHIQFYNFEDPDVFALGDYKQIYDYIKVRLIAGKMNYIFLDEVQNVKTFERLVDGLFIKKNVDLYITGSNAYLLSGELATLLTGRYIEISILPISFKEYWENSQQSSKNGSFADFEGPSPNSQNLSKNESFRNLEDDPANSQNLSRGEPSPLRGLVEGSKIDFLGNFIYAGGIPATVNLFRRSPEQADTFINGILNTIIEKDIFTRREIYNKPTFQKIVDFLLDSIGSFASPGSISNTFKSDGIVIDNKTVTQYLDYLTSAFLFYKVPRYNIKGKNLLRTLDKYYVADTGFRRARLSKRYGADVGYLLENVVYLELRRRNKRVFIGKLRDMEIDFVVEDNQGYISYYQVAWSVTEPVTLERELAPLRAIRDSNPKYLLTADWDVNPVYDGIRKYNVADWLLEKEHTI
jgi:predicted AAA+ superfamily ATPase